MDSMYSVGILKSDGKFTSEVKEDELHMAYIYAHKLSIVKREYTAVTFHPYDEPSEKVAVFYDGIKIFERDWYV